MNKLVQAFQYILDLVFGSESEQTESKPNWNSKELNSMTKKELIELGSQHGKTLSNSKTKKALVQELLDMCK